MQALRPHGSLLGGELFLEYDVLRFLIFVVVVFAEHDVSVTGQDVVRLGFVSAFAKEVTVA